MKVDTIIAHGVLVTMDADFRVIADGALAMAADRIVAVGSSDQILGEFEAANTVDCHDCAIIPGLVNAHTHAPMTLLRGLADDLRLDVWLHGYMMPVEREFVNPEFVRLGTELACAEMICGGVTCFADMYYFEDSVAQAAAEAGLRAVCSQTVLKFLSPDASSYEESLDYCRAFIEKWKGHPLIVPSVGPHAPYTCTPEILRAATDLAVQYDVPLHIHLSETALEVEDSRKTRGAPPVAWVKKQGLFRARVLAAHCVHVDGGEIRDLGQARAGVSHNPSSNLKLASGIAPVGPMLKEGLHVGIGTDGTASNNDLDMFEEMRLATFLAKVASGDPVVVPARQTLAMATIEGARALFLGDITGSLEPGKRADIAVVGLNGLHNTPRFARDPDAIYSELVYACKSTDVRHVWVNGRPLLVEGALQTIDVDQVRAQAQALAQRIDAFLAAREGNLLDKLVAIGGLEQEEMFEVQVKVRLDAPALACVQAALKSSDGVISIQRSSVRRQFDTYFVFADPAAGRIRYREDEILGADGQVLESRYRLTLTGPTKEREFANSVLLSRSRSTSRADRSLRFYREYFRPLHEFEVYKERRRYHILFKGFDLALNIDDVTQPDLGQYLEIKSRTWSSRDAARKAELINEFLIAIGLGTSQVSREEYFDLAQANSSRSQ
jgi:5-methylthioadenosine/S-adenosylhomocysteine deaminase